MSLQIYKPNPKNAGCACSFRFGVDMKTKDPVVYVNAIQQHSGITIKKSVVSLKTETTQTKT